MRTIIAIVICMIGFTAIARAQDACPKLTMSPPRHEGKFFGRGETYLIGVVINPADQEKDTSPTWELSPAIAYKEVDAETMIPVRKGLHYISFVATPDLQYATITASVKVEGLPPNCPNTGTTAFKIQFDTESPRVIMKLPRKILPELEEANLAAFAHTLRNADDTVIALLVVNYSKTDTKRTLRKYVERISGILVRLNFPEDKFLFVFDKKDGGLVTAYGWPREREHSWETDIERLEIPE